MGKKTETQPIKWSRAMMLLDAMRDKGDDNTRLMLACGFFFGLRISDILQLKWSDILQEEFRITETKTIKERKISIHQKFKEIRDQVIKNLGYTPSGLIFVSQRTGSDETKPISVNAANKRIRKVFEEYDIKCDNPSSHTLRKTFGRRVYEANNKSEDALVLLSHIFNHANISITRRYIGLTEERIGNAYLNL